ncbi:MAG TPA: YggS family pyridoxal phosphate-dependent enzyme [Polyangiales bacterium]
MSGLAQRFAAVQARIARACEDAGRDPASVKLLAVSKFQPLAAVREAYALGQREFGENYAQELADKAQALSDLPGLRFRFIGGLQRNKAKLLAPLGCAVETLASASTASALHERLPEGAPALEVMLQVNSSGEAQKSGVAPAELPELLAAVRRLPRLHVSGLMTIPQADDPAAARRAYRGLRELAEAHALPELSMGMSDDLEIAIAEGATRVRVGTALFGPRTT